jgi:membrane-bound ClpP family serine protease
MSDLFTLYWILVAAGFLLIAAEIFIPGGILGVIGIFALLGAGMTGFAVFGAKGGLFSALGLFVGGTLFLALWIKYCPTSFLGKWFTLKEDGREYKSYDDSRMPLLGKEGAAHTDLRPAGIATINGERIDVVSEAGFITKGSAVKVIEVAGNRVVVRQLEA